MSGPTGFYDASGIPIHVGDLIRVKHYQHRRGRRVMYLYFRVAFHPLRDCDTEDRSLYVVQNWHCLDATRWQCLLADAGLESAEVLTDSWDERNEQGELITFNERKRKAKS